MPLSVSRKKSLQSLGFVALSGESVRAGVGAQAMAEANRIDESFQGLARDRHMGDGGRYRFRRYSRFLCRLDAQTGRFEFPPLSGTEIHQEKVDNPLNGGVTRTFEPLDSWVSQSAFLDALLRHDAALLMALDPDLFLRPVPVGVHQIRIVAEPETQGKPTPEGVHRDAETYTIQHFLFREGIERGEFRAYDSGKKETFRWLQDSLLDSVLFTGTTWHSATPIACLPECERGHRDIFLVDFTSEVQPHGED